MSRQEVSGKYHWTSLLIQASQDPKRTAGPFKCWSNFRFLWHFGPLETRNSFTLFNSMIGTRAVFLWDVPPPRGGNGLCDSPHTHLDIRIHSVLSTMSWRTVVQRPDAISANFSFPFDSASNDSLLHLFLTSDFRVRGLLAATATAFNADGSVNYEIVPNHCTTTYRLYFSSFYRSVCLLHFHSKIGN